MTSYCVGSVFIEFHKNSRKNSLKTLLIKKEEECRQKRLPINALASLRESSLTSVLTSEKLNES